MTYAIKPCRLCGAERNRLDVVRGGGVRCWPCRLAAATAALAAQEHEESIRTEPRNPNNKRGPRRDLARDMRIAEIYQAGYTLHEVGVVFGITRERVRQIVRRQGVTPADGGICLRSENRKAAIAAKKLAALNARAMADFGCEWQALLALNDGKRPWTKGSRCWQFIQQRRNAVKRGIAWNLTLQQWVAIWEDSGKWALRGKGGDKFVMCRKQDFGPYAAWNVYITTNRQNVTDYQAELKRRGVKCADGYKRLPERAAQFASSEASA